MDKEVLDAIWKKILSEKLQADKKVINRVIAITDEVIGKEIETMHKDAAEVTRKLTELGDEVEEMLERFPDPLAREKEELKHQQPRREPPKSDKSKAQSSSKQSSVGDAPRERSGKPQWRKK